MRQSLTLGVVVTALLVGCGGDNGGVGGGGAQVERLQEKLQEERRSLDAPDAAPE